jgi:acetyl esterase/lipase
MIPWLFLTVTLIGALFTFNAYLPQRRTGPFIIPSFFGGWLTSELSGHHFAWQLGATVLFVWAGALDAWPGWVGLGVTVASWGALAALIPISRSAEPVLEAALVAGLGPDYRDDIPSAQNLELDEAEPPPRWPLNPFRFAHSDVVVTRDIPYVQGGGPRNQLDIYAPRAGASRAPVLLQVHGGGWVIGNKREQALPLMHHLAARGWVCVTANYRLSPKATFPDHLVDLKRAVQWIRNEIADYGGDPDFIAATGGSAGGHLSAMLGLTANLPEYQPGFEDVDTRMQAVVPFYGVYDFSNHYGLQAGRGMDSFVAKTVLKQDPVTAPEAFRNASPMHRLHSDAPPFFVIHGSHDSLASVEEARHFAQMLGRMSKSPVVYGEIPGAQHAFEIFHSLRTSATVQAVDRFLTWVHARYRARPGQG